MDQYAVQLNTISEPHPCHFPFDPVLALKVYLSDYARYKSKTI